MYKLSRKLIEIEFAVNQCSTLGAFTQGEQTPCVVTIAFYY